MTAVDLAVEPGTLLHLLAGEWFPTPGRAADRDTLVAVVAVYRQEIAGMVWVRGHVCGRGAPDCGTGACFEHQVITAAIRANLDGAR
ncbi:hypothetical protein ABZY58_11485 [Micromonospora tulbaghiae]|uniref:hypothetical protein n=1 Tax=Micromonospora tulbaghiae TaxID=479978 RepID=UPI0033A34761